MKGLLWVLTLAALAVGIAVAAHYNDGYVLLIIPPYRTEISLNLAILFLFAGFVVLYAVLRGLALTLSLPQRVREFRERRLRDKTAAEVTEITRLIYEGRFGLALKKAAAVHATGQSAALAAAPARTAQAKGVAGKSGAGRSQNAAGLLDDGGRNARRDAAFR